jgi:hypothetical protein
MLAPRRVGKTVLLERLKEESGSKGYRAIVLDVEGYREERAFFREMCASIQEEIGAGQTLLASFAERLKRVVQGAEFEGDWRNLLLKVDWALFADNLIAQLEDEKDGKTWLFLVDEITIFTKALLDGPEGRERASEFLYLLRRLCREHPRVRWLYTGSIGLDTLARRHGIEGALVDLDIFQLEPFGEATAKGFLQQLATRSGCSITDDGLSALLGRLGWLAPYYLGKIGEAACELAAAKVIDETVANEAGDSLLKLEHRIYWSTWREHLDKNFPEPEKTRLFNLLAEIARSPRGATLDTLLLILNRGSEGFGGEVLREYLDTLEADGYVTGDETRGRFRFRLNLLREWWLRYVALPVA